MMVFFEGMRLNLDGLDGCLFYWHNMRNAHKVLGRYYTGGAFSMVWAAFLYFELSIWHLSAKKWTVMSAEMC